MKEYNWITVEEAAIRFSTPESVIRAVVANGAKIPKKKMWRDIVPRGKERYAFRGKTASGYKVLIREDAIRIWCETRNLYMRDKSIAHTAQLDLPKLSIVKGLPLEVVSDMARKSKNLRKIHDEYRNHK